MLKWPCPSRIKQLCGFLGLTGCYRWFIRNYAHVAHSLTDLLKKYSFTWSTDAQTAFENLKTFVTNAQVLILPDFLKTFIVQTNATSTGLGVVLQQNGHPIAFLSKKFYNKLKNASTYLRELHAITTAVQKWRHYLSLLLSKKGDTIFSGTNSWLRLIKKA